MNKKIGILTFHRALSYGAMLQAYALQNFMWNLGIENEIVDYNCKYMVDHYQKNFRKTYGNPIKGFAWNLMTLKGIKKERITRNTFVNARLKLSKGYSAETIKSAKDSYSAFISGSDQVWSPTCVGFDPVYFLTFANPCQKYSYSASIATKTIPENLKEEYKKRLADFQMYSVREQSGAEIVKDLTGKEAFVNIDPTLLLSKNQWDKLATDVLNEPYIFLFTVHKPKNLINYALELSQKTGLKVIYLNKFKSVKHKNLQYLDPVTADKFVGLIKNAKYVCTNSFHGTAFSVIYHKNFVVETDTCKGKNIRSEELLKSLGLEKQILNSEGFINIDHKSDWNYVEEKLNEERKKSENYLLSIQQQIKGAP